MSPKTLVLALPTSNQEPTSSVTDYAETNLSGRPTFIIFATKRTKVTKQTKNKKSFRLFRSFRVFRVKNYLGGRHAREPDSTVVFRCTNK